MDELLVDAKVVDPQVMAILLTELGDEGPAVIADIIRTFRAECSGLLNALGDAASAGEVGKVVHRLRGSALSLGAVELSAICAQAEAAARSGDLVRARSFLVPIDDALQRTLDVLARTHPPLHP